VLGNTSNLFALATGSGLNVSLTRHPPFVESGYQQ
jgi:hypothetical protein